MPFTVTRDAISPTVAITVPARSGIITVTVQWSGDDGTGAGAHTYDVQVRVDGGPWTGWLTDTTQTQAEYEGEPGHAYGFRARARDNVGNLGDWAEATTAVVQVTKYYHFPSTGSGRGGGQRVCQAASDVL